MRHQQQKVGMKLPTMELPTFSGNPLEWQTFYDHYKVAVHNNADIPDIQKFTHLRCLLKGGAAAAIEGYDITEDNYRSVIEKLETRFGQPQLINSAHSQRLMSAPAVSDIGNVKGMRTLLDMCEASVRALTKTCGPTALGVGAADQDKMAHRDHCGL